MTRSDKWWILIISFLAAVIILGGATIWLKYTPGQPLEITLPPDAPAAQGDIYVGGEVNNPGYYPLEEGDTLSGVIRAAGGTTPSADTDQLELRVPGISEEELPQKVNLNRAEAWLLEALPGIGETRAQAIIDYREQHGPFRHTGELINVEGIGTATYKKIKNLVTVAE